MKTNPRWKPGTDRTSTGHTSVQRFSATVDPNVLATAKLFAGATGFRNSFSAYLNDVLDRDNKRRSELLHAQA